MADMDKREKRIRAEEKGDYSHSNDKHSMAHGKVLSEAMNRAKKGKAKSMKTATAADRRKNPYLSVDSKLLK